MMRLAVDTLDDGISTAAQLVVEAARDETADDAGWLALAVQH